jgi:hypothetical protein
VCIDLARRKERAERAMKDVRKLRVSEIFVTETNS